MELKFLGNGSGYHSAYCNSNAYFEAENNLVLIDCGESSYARIRELNLLEACKGEIFVLITHTHADHIGSLATLCSYCYYVLGKKVQVIHPNKSVQLLLQLMGISESEYIYYKDFPNKAMSTLEVTPILVEHVEDMVCYGYLLKLEDECIFFSGDANKIPAQVVSGIEKGCIQRIYQDTCSYESEHKTHASLEDIKKQIAPMFRERVYCMHLDCDFKTIIKEAGFQVVESQR